MESNTASRKWLSSVRSKQRIMTFPEIPKYVDLGENPFQIDFDKKKKFFGL